MAKSESEFDDRFFKKDTPNFSGSNSSNPAEKSKLGCVGVAILVIVVLAFVGLVFGDSSPSSSIRPDSAFVKCLVDDGYHREFQAGNESKAFAILDKCNARYPKAP